MKLPSPPWFTVSELTERWDTSIAVIDRYIASGELIASDRYTNPESQDYWVDRSDIQRKTEYRLKYEELLSEHYDYDGEYIKLEEVERFEKEHDITVGGNQEQNIAENLPNETDAEMAKRLLPAGEKIKEVSDKLKKEIARKLKAAFPSITPHRVGKLLSNPNDPISTSGFQKRGRKYLGLTSGKKAK